MNKHKAGIGTKVCTKDKEMLCNIFRCSPVSLWEEDFSEIKVHFDHLKSKGITDLKSYFREHPDEVISLAGKVKIISVNDAALKLYQAGSEEELCQGLHLVFNKETYDRFREELIALSEGKTDFETEAVTRTLKGEERYIYVKLVVAPGYEDTLAKVFVNIVDVTGIKKKLEDLVESEEKYRKIFEINDDAILIIDRESGIILDSNLMAEQMLGLSLEDIIGKHFTELCPEEEVKYYMDIYKGIEKHKQVSEDSVVCHETGKKIPVKITGRAVELSTGRNVAGWFFREKTKDYAGEKYTAMDSKLANLTSREREIFTMVAKGLTNSQIACRLFISIKTVETHRTHIMVKMGIHKEADFVRYAVSKGIIRPASIKLN